MLQRYKLLFLVSGKIRKMSLMPCLLKTLDVLVFMWFTKGGMVGGHLVRDSEPSQSIPQIWWIFGHLHNSHVVTSHYFQQTANSYSERFLSPRVSTEYQQCYAMYSS